MEESPLTTEPAIETAPEKPWVMMKRREDQRREELRLIARNEDTLVEWMLEVEGRGRPFRFYDIG